MGTYDHSIYPERLGLPVWLAQLQDRIYESLPRDDRRLDVLWTEDLLLEELRACAPPAEGGARP